ncbi:MAG: gamma-glutamyltransferase, partial [Phycisphaerae bacterium]|nr:gamma-glutamyltransferase [Phycisphaerae bacterium]
MIRLPASLLIGFCTLLGACSPATRTDTARPPRAGQAQGTRGVAATVHPLATRAAIDVMKAGGNAVDAAVAAALTLGVVDSHNSGIGGGCFMLIRCADGALLAIDGREKAPATATRDMYVRDGKAVSELSKTGALAIGIPGSLATYDYALGKCGRRRLAQLLEPAADLAEQGFAIDATFAQRLGRTADALARFPESARVLLDPDGRPWPQGHVLRQPDLALTYRRIARQGTSWFYGGAFAQATEAWMKNHHGLVSARDFADYRIKVRQPVVSRYRDYTVVGFPPSSSGGIHVAQILNILERFDLRKLDKEDRAQRLHVTAEAMKLAFADRAHWVGDPEFVKVPRGLADPDYAQSLAVRIDRARSHDVAGHGTPPRAATDYFNHDKHTTHIATADAEGNWVALTTTLNTSFGSKVMIPGTGVLMNNQMDDFSAQPGVPNAFGLVGAEANAVAGGKRPLSSMSPTLLLRDGEPVLTLGAAGGPTIINQVAGAI